MSRRDMRIAQLENEIRYTEKLIEALEAEKVKDMQVEPFKTRLVSLQNELNKQG